MEDMPVLDEMVLKPKPNDKKQITTFRIMSMLSLIYCLFMIITEATVIYDPHKTLMYLVSSFIKTDRSIACGDASFVEVS
jgi:hypothetical protein